MSDYKASASNDWRMLSVQSRLGEALIGLNRFAEAEGLLVESHQGLRERAWTIPASRKSVIKEAGARILQLYTAWGKPEKVEEWKRRLSESSGNGY